MSRTFPLAALALLLFAAVAPLRAAEASSTRQKQCEMTVGGKSVVHGRCAVVTMPDGSFTFNAARPGHAVGHFAFVTVEPDGSATASWNADGGLHAWTPIGTVTHDGNCWVNPEARICTSAK